jgi:hypothetical protein
MWLLLLGYPHLLQVVPGSSFAGPNGTLVRNLVAQLLRVGFVLEGVRRVNAAGVTLPGGPR